MATFWGEARRLRKTGDSSGHRKHQSLLRSSRLTPRDRSVLLSDPEVQAMGSLVLIQAQQTGELSGLQSVVVPEVVWAADYNKRDEEVVEVSIKTASSQEAIKRRSREVVSDIHLAFFNL